MKIEIAGRVYTNQGELLDKRVSSLIEAVDLLFVLRILAQDEGYYTLSLGDAYTVTIRVDCIEVIDPEEDD